MWLCVKVLNLYNQGTADHLLLIYDKKEKDRRKEFKSSSATESQLYCRYVP